jgi:hypothetical protein
MSSHRPGFLHGHAIGLAAALLCCTVATARAEVHIEGGPEAVRVTASHEAVANILAAFAARFNIKYHSAISLDAAADGVYSGSLRQVISRLLDGCNYVIKSDKDTFEILVLDKNGATAIAAPQPRPIPARSQGVVSQWR